MRDVSIAIAALAFFIGTGIQKARAQQRVYHTKTLKMATFPANGWVISGPFVTVGSDCRGTVTAAIRIVQKPRHGRLQLFVGRGPIYFKDRRPIRRCNELPVNGSFVRYRA